MSGTCERIAPATFAFDSHRNDLKPPEFVRYDQGAFACADPKRSWNARLAGIFYGNASSRLIRYIIPKHPTFHILSNYLLSALDNDFGNANLVSLACVSVCKSRNPKGLTQGSLEGNTARPMGLASQPQLGDVATEVPPGCRA